ncbi:hypothetical protein N431DRAFT_386847 [Stipitochalara longipes BDJ]|nr:hypothetical protein N431DRAFT_386847 [Stipitochalara longipes BDJ]
MEAVAALSIACNVMQVISFGHETISLCKRLHHGGSLNADLEHNARHLSGLSESLRDSISAARTARPLTKEQNDLKAVAERCLEASTKLRHELDKFSMPGTPSGLATLKKAFRAQFRKNSIEALRKIMNECQSTLQSDLLFRLWNSNEVAILEQRQEWQKLHKDAQTFAQQHTEGFKQTSELVLAESLSTRLQISNEGAATREYVETNIRNQSRDVALEKQCDRLLGSLKYGDMNARRNHVSESHESTFQWIFDESIQRPWNNFMQWLKSDERLYWINGKAGSGKSTLMKFIIDDPRTKEALESWLPGTSIIAAYIWNAGQPMQCSLKGILCSLLHQLLEGERAVAMALCTEVPVISNKDSHNDWSVTELKNTLFNILDQHSSPVCIFLDGLDEISQAEGTFDLMDLVEKLKNLPKVKVCVSSRPERHLQLCLGKYPSLKLQDLTASDIRQYVTDFLERLSGQIREHGDSQTLILELIDSVVEKADGVFLWVHLALMSLKRGMTSEDEWSKLTQRLEMLPGGLQQLYQQMWLRLNEDKELYRAEASYYFNMVIEATSEPVEDLSDGTISLFEFTILTNDYLQRAFLEEETPPTDEKMTETCRRVRTCVEVRCAGLLEFYSIVDRSRSSSITVNSTEDLAENVAIGDDDPKKVGLDFIHRTARDFLLQTEEGQAILLHDPMSINQRYIRVIRTQLSNVIWGEWDHDLSLFMCALRVAQRPISGSQEQELLHLFERMIDKGYLIPDARYDSNREDKIRPYQRGGDFLRVAARFGCKDFIQYKLADAQATTEYKTYLLHQASCWGEGIPVMPPEDLKTSLQKKVALIRWLLDSGADPNARVYSPFQNLYWRNAFAGLLDNIIVCRDWDRSEFQEVLVNIIEIFLRHNADLSSTMYLSAFAEDGFSAFTGYELCTSHWSFWSSEDLDRVVLVEVNTAQLLHMATTSLFQIDDAERDTMLDDWSHQNTCQRYRQVLLVGKSHPSPDHRRVFRTVTDDDSSYILEAIDALHAAMKSKSWERADSTKRFQEVERRIDQSFETGGKKVDPKEFLIKKELMASEATIDRYPPKMSL